MLSKKGFVMKAMKTRCYGMIVISVLFLAILILTSCDPVNYRFNAVELEKDLDHIELIRYENEQQKKFTVWVSDHSSEILPFNEINATVIDNIDEGKTSDFLEEISGYTVLDRYYVYDSPQGYCIRMLYNNGDFIIIGSDFIAKYSSDGRVKAFIGTFASMEIRDLVNKYFDKLRID